MASTACPAPAPCPKLSVGARAKVPPPAFFFSSFARRRDARPRQARARELPRAGNGSTPLMLGPAVKLRAALAQTEAPCPAPPACECPAPAPAASWAALVVKALLLVYCAASPALLVVLRDDRARAEAHAVALEAARAKIAADLADARELQLFE